MKTANALGIWINVAAGLSLIFACRNPVGLVNIAVAVGLSIVAVVESVINSDAESR